LIGLDHGLASGRWKQDMQGKQSGKLYTFRMMVEMMDLEMEDFIDMIKGAQIVFI
jgi:hypothetical protein